MNNHRIIALSILILAAVILRFLPQPPNFTPIAALALFTGVFFRGRLTAYIAAIPFFHYMIISTLLYSAVFFGTFLYAEKLFLAVREENSSLKA